MVSTVSPQDAFIHGQLLNLVRTEKAVTKPALEHATGLSRKIVAQRVHQAIEAGLLEEGELAPSGGGRPSRLLRFRAGAGHVLAGAIGAGEMSAAIATLDGTLVGMSHVDWDVAKGPEATLTVLDGMFQKLRRKTKVDAWAIGVGVPGPVDFATGRLVAPLIMPGWDGYSVRSWFRDRYDVPVWVDNDVNLMALGEWRRGEPKEDRDLLFVKVGTGVGSGLVSQGSVYHGDTGAAGDIGHVAISDDATLQCRCGQVGCLEAASGGWGLVNRLLPSVAESPILSARLRTRGWLVPEDVGFAASQGEPLARSTVLEAARLVGTSVAGLVNFVNPGVVVIGGGMLRVGPEPFEVLRQALLERCTPLAARRLVVRPASLDFREGVIGAAVMAIDQIFAPRALGAWIDVGSPVGQGALVQQAIAG